MSHVSLTLLDFIFLIISGEDCKFWGFLLYNFLHLRVICNTVNTLLFLSVILILLIVHVSNFFFYLWFEVLTTLKMSVVVFWVVMLFSLVSGYQCFIETYHLHLQGWSSTSLHFKPLHFLFYSWASEFFLYVCYVWFGGNSTANILLGLIILT
jgi:hypothetical protein